MALQRLISVALLLTIFSGCAQVVRPTMDVPKPAAEAPPPVAAAPEPAPTVGAAPPPYPVMAPPPAPAPVPGQPFAVVKVYFGTDRNLTNNPDVDQYFGGDRSELRYGTAEVSIPLSHRSGQMERPVWWRFETRQDPGKHVVLKSIAVSDPASFFAEVAKEVGGAPVKKAFVFVHGFNVTFAEAARRTAQLHYDLKFDGVPLFYSWPSKGDVAKYPADEDTVRWSEKYLKDFLQDFFKFSDADQVYLIAHSMGNRALTGAITRLVASDGDIRRRLKEIILAAPDIDAAIFKRDIAPVMAQAGGGVTLYASRDDLALDASRKIHADARAGDTAHGLVIVPGMDTIDATGIDTSLLGHGYVFELISDLQKLLSGERPRKRGLLEVSVPIGTYWKLKADAD